MPVNAYETSGAFVIVAPLPAVTAEDVTIDLLEATVQRVTDGAVRMLELRADGTGARKRPGPPCRWCPIADDCLEGRSYLDERDELDDR